MNKFILYLVLFISFSCGKEYRRAYINNKPDVTIFGIVVYHNTSNIGNLFTTDYERLELTEFKTEGNDIIILEKGIKPKILSVDFDKYIDFPLGNYNNGYYYAWRSLKLGSCYFVTKIGYTITRPSSETSTQNNYVQTSYEKEFSYEQSGKALEICAKVGENFVGILGYDPVEEESFNFIEKPKFYYDYFNSYLFGLNKPSYRGAQRYAFDIYNKPYKD